MTALLTITDNISGDGQTVYADDVVTALAPWYPGAPAEVTDAVAAIQDAALRGAWEQIIGLAAFLDVTVERTACDECGKPATRMIVPADPQAFAWPVCDRHHAEAAAEDAAEAAALAEPGVDPATVSTHPAVRTERRENRSAERPAYVVNVVRAAAGYNDGHPFAAAWSIDETGDTYTVRVGAKVVGTGTRVAALATLERIADALVAQGVAAPVADR